MGALAKAGRGLAEVLRVPFRLSYGYHSWGRQLKETPFGLTARRIGQVVTGRSPMIRPLWDAEESVMTLLSLHQGVLEVGRLWSRSAKDALQKQGIERIVVTDFNTLMFGIQRAMLILKRCAAGMEEGKEYVLCLGGSSPRPDFMSMVRKGAEVTVVSRLKLSHETSPS